MRKLFYVGFKMEKYWGERSARGEEDINFKLDARKPVTRSSNKIIMASSLTSLDKDEEMEVVNIANE